MAAPEAGEGFGGGSDALALARERIAPLMQIVHAINASAHRPLKQRQLASRGLEAARSLGLPADCFVVVGFLLQVITTWQLPERFEDNYVDGRPSFAAEEVAWREDTAHTLQPSREAAALLAARHAAGSFFLASAEEVAWAALGDMSPGSDAALMLVQLLGQALTRWPVALRRGAEGQRLLRLTVRVMAEVDARGHVARCAISGAALPSTAQYGSTAHALTMRLQAVPECVALARDACDAAALDSLRARFLRFLDAAGGPLGAVGAAGLLGAASLASLAAGYGSVAARAGADREAHGLRACALPACGAREPHARAFKVCARCRAACYCCAEHQREDWKRHKRDGDGCKAAST
jgi:hypothetical protein